MLKTISAEHARNPEYVELFVDEANLAAQIRHPNVVETFAIRISSTLLPRDNSPR